MRCTSISARGQRCPKDAVHPVAKPKTCAHHWRQQARNEPELRTLVALLGAGCFVTAKQIVIETKCSKPSVHRRLKELKKRGHVIKTCRLREGSTGPKSIAYAIVRAA